MTTMTCKQLGGPCDLPLHGEDHNEVIHAQDTHLREAYAAALRERYLWHEFGDLHLILP